MPSTIDVYYILQSFTGLTTPPNTVFFIQRVQSFVSKNSYRYFQKYYRNTIDVIETEIDFSQKVLLPDIPKIKQSYLGYVDYEEYLKLIVGDNGEIRKNVFYDNVRDYQGDNEVNIEIA